MLKIFYKSSEYYFTYFNNLINTMLYENMDNNTINTNNSVRVVGKKQISQTIKGRVIFDKIIETHEINYSEYGCGGIQYIISLKFSQPDYTKYLTEYMRIKINHPNRITSKKYTPLKIDENNISISVFIDKNKTEYNDVDQLIINSKYDDVLEFEIENYV